VIIAASMLVALAACYASACRSHEPQVTIVTEAGSVPVRVELALTEDQQRRGLMFRDHLDEDRGMLFVFRHARPRSFWMKNTQIPLDIVYVDAAGKIVSIAERTTPYSERPIPSKLPAKYVLEVVGGFSQEHGVRPGQRIVLPEDIDEKAAARKAETEP